MPNKHVIPSDEILIFCSKYLIYHVKMYVETLNWLRKHRHCKDWNTERNAILESHLVHARVLIDFLSKSSRESREDDVIAVDYFYDISDKFKPLQDDFLKSQRDWIGGKLVHITTKHIPRLKSEQEWPVEEITNKLIPQLKVFLMDVPESRLADGMKSECLSYLQALWALPIPFSINAST